MRQHFGAAAEVRVLGSRARPEARGGDLDLHVRVPGPAPGKAAELRALAALERAVDERRVDLLVLGADDLPRRVDAAALETGVLL